jgi:hypothetical protein
LIDRQVALLINDDQVVRTIFGSRQAHPFVTPVEGTLARPGVRAINDAFSTVIQLGAGQGACQVQGRAAFVNRCAGRAAALARNTS